MIRSEENAKRKIIANFHDFKSILFAYMMEFMINVDQEVEDEEVSM